MRESVPYILEDIDMNTPTTHSASDHQSYKMFRMKQLVEYIGLSRSTLYDIMDVQSKRYDPTFPSPIKLTEGTVCWLKSEIDCWLSSKIKQSRG